jgi:hypothetical protein
VLLRWTAGHFSLYDTQGPGTLLADVSDPAVTGRQMDVAPDGSSVMSWTGTTVAAWQRNGTLLFNHTLSGTIQGTGGIWGVVILADRVLAVTSANSNTRLETVLLPSGTSSVSNPLEGTFDRWFLDGSHFSMVFGGATRIYDTTATQVDSTNNSYTVGWGDKIVQVSGASVQVFRLGALGTPIFQKTYNNAQSYVDPSVTAAAAAIIITGPTGYDGPYTLVRLDRPDVVEETYDLFAVLGNGAPWFDRTGHWVVELGHGAVYDSYNASSLANPYALSCGQTLLRGGSTGKAALVTAAGTILLDTSGGKLAVVGTIRKLAANAEFVGDGSKLALVSTGPSLQATSAPPVSEQALRTYDATTGSLLSKLDGVTDVGVSADGSKLFVRMGSSDEETDLSGTAIFTDQGHSTALRLSPTGKGVAAVDGPTGVQTPPATRIYLSGTYQGSIGASVAGWISEAQVIGNTYMFEPRVGIVWTGGAVFDLSGNVVKSVTLPVSQPPSIGPTNGYFTDQIFGLRLLPTGHVFFRSHNQIRDVVADTAVWTDGTGTPNPGDLVGAYDAYIANQHTVTFAAPTP